eukprot:4839826-Pyramimonas_sp.AAC.1
MARNPRYKNEDLAGVFSVLSSKGRGDCRRNDQLRSQGDDNLVRADRMASGGPQNGQQLSIQYPIN